MTPALLALTFVLIGLAIDVQLFAPQMQAWLDRLILPARVQQQRAELRETGEALARADAVDLAAHGMPDTPLDRAAALKAVLTAQIAKLRPSAGDGITFGTSDAWRHYNALHFPYVVGLKPYSTRAAVNGHGALAPADSAALEWFQSAVPERTLHNWQTAAARVIAHELRRGSAHKT